VEFRLLGPVELVDDGGRAVDLPAGKPRALLALLLLDSGRVVSVDRIVDALWDGQAPATAAAAVQVYASRLRKLMPDGVLVRRGPGYVLGVEDGQVDLDRFERLRREGAAAAAEGRWRQAATLLDEALALWRGKPLADVRFDSFARDEVARLDELRLVALEQRLEAELALGRAAQAAPELEALVREHPLRERLRELLMLALYRAGRQADALAAYQDARATLDEELGLEPTHALQKLERAILVQDPALELRRSRLLAGAPDGPAPVPGPLVPASPFPFVGRVDELASLRALLARAEEGEGAFVLLGGEAGAGKTRFVRELAHEAAAAGVLVCYGVSDPAVSTPYQPLLEWVEFLLRVCDPGALRECIAGDALTSLLPQLSQLTDAPAPEEAETDRFALQHAAIELLRRSSTLQPLLLVADDVHWADGETLHLLRRLARAAPDARLVVVAAYRDRGEPAVAELSETLADLSRLDGVSRIRLGNLSSTEVEGFIRGTSGAEPAVGLASAIGELTEGTPLLLCELWRDLEAGGMVAISDTVAVTRPLGELHGPERVGDLVWHRLWRLAPATVALLELAAVAGPRFELTLIAHAAGLDRPALLTALDESVDGGILEEMLGPAPAWAFTHELVRRAVYDRIKRMRRAELHLRVGEALERMQGPDLARWLPELAYHFTGAAAVGGKQRAIEYNLRAAEAAAAAGASNEAAAALATALELGIDDPGERLRLQVDLARALNNAGRVVEADTTLTETIDAATALEERGIAAHALLERFSGPHMGTDRGLLVRLGKHRAEIEDAIEAFAELGDERGLSLAHLLLGAGFNFGDQAAVLAEYELAWAHAKASGDREECWRSITFLTSRLVTARPVGDAIARLEELLESVRGDRVLEAVAGGRLGSVYAMAGRADEALALLHEADAVLGGGSRVRYSRVFLGYGMELAGDRAGAERQYEAAWLYWRDVRPGGFDRRAVGSAVNLARFYCDDGRWDDAENLLVFVRQVPVHPDRPVQSDLLAVEARVAASQGRHAEAAALAACAVDGLDAEANLNTRAWVWLAIGEVQRAAGNSPTADAADARALELYELKGNVAAARRLRSAVGSA
jgi:DNA-binding SARP family transcriptional activator